MWPGEEFQSSLPGRRHRSHALKGNRPYPSAAACRSLHSLRPRCGTERHLRRLAAEPDWTKQRQLWIRLQASLANGTGDGRVASRCNLYAVIGAGFLVVNSHPVKAEMSVAASKSQAKEPIQLDIIVVCRKAALGREPRSLARALESARTKLDRLRSADFTLSRNDCRIVLHGQLLTTLSSTADAVHVAQRVEEELLTVDRLGPRSGPKVCQRELF